MTLSCVKKSRSFFCIHPASFLSSFRVSPHLCFFIKRYLDPPAPLRSSNKSWRMNSENQASNTASRPRWTFTPTLVMHSVWAKGNCVRFQSLGLWWRKTISAARWRPPQPPSYQLGLCSKQYRYVGRSWATPYVVVLHNRRDRRTPADEDPISTSLYNWNTQQ